MRMKGKIQREIDEQVKWINAHTFAYTRLQITQVGKLLTEIEIEIVIQIDNIYCNNTPKLSSVRTRLRNTMSEYGVRVARMR